jgi:hypothetical protein
MEAAMRIGLFMAALAAGLFLDGRASDARYEGPWCAVQTVGGDTVTYDCSMRTFEECRLQVVAGNRGHCEQNARWPGWYGKPVVGGPKRPRKRRAR